MSITHAQVVATAPDGSSDVQSDDWNAAHVIAGMAGAPWTSWSPIIKAGSTTCTWTGEAKYLDLGAVVFWYLNVSFTSGASSGLITITNLPAALQSHDGGAIMGDVFWQDQGVNFYYLMAYAQTTTEWRFYRDAAAGNQFSAAIGTSPQDSATGWGVIVHNAETFDVPTLGAGVGAHAYHSTTQSITNNTPEAATFDSEFYDSDGFHSGAAPTRLTVPANMGGKYHIHGYAEFAANATGIRLAWLRKNGTTDIAEGNEMNLQGSASFGSSLVTLATVDLVAGDYVEMMVYHNRGSALNIGFASASPAQTKLSIMRLDSGSGLGAWTSYTPTWTTTGTAPSLGNGTLLGRYKMLDSRTMVVRIGFVAGSTTTFGTGEWSFALPVATANDGLTQLLTGWIVDSGTDNKTAVGRIVAADTKVTAIVPEGGNEVINTVPMTWAVNDALILQGTLEV